MSPLPGGATVGAVVPFFVALGVTSLFSWLYLRRYRNPYERDASTFITSVLSLIIALVTSALLPVDIFLVSFMKDPESGQFKPFAAEQDSRDQIENAMLYTYYALYGVIFVLIFAIIPFVYFYFEEDDEGLGFGQNHDRCWSALKYTIGFIFVAVAIFVAGAVIPLKDAPSGNSTSEWDKMEFLWDNLGKDRGQDALSMVLSVVSVLGMINLVFYTGFGIFSWPMGLIRGTKSARNQIEEIQDQHLSNQPRINALRDRQRTNGTLSKRDQAQLERLEEQERQANRDEQTLGEFRQGLWYKCRFVIRPMEIALGVVLGLLALLIWISLILTNIDKAMNGLGMRMGYALPKRTLPNPMDMMLVTLQKVFPLDYILILVVTWFLVLCTMSGIRNLGIRVFGVKLYALRPKRTRPQGLLLTCVTLMITVLALNIFLYLLSPQYATFGNQKYIRVNNGSANLSELVVADIGDEEWGNGSAITTDLVKCDLAAKPEQCTMTRNSALITRFFYKAWIFGAIYYWASWAFIAMSALALVYVILRKSRSITDNDEDDLEESEDEDLIRRRSQRRQQAARD